MTARLIKRIHFFINLPMPKGLIGLKMYVSLAVHKTHMLLMTLLDSNFAEKHKKTRNIILYCTFLDEGECMLTWLKI